jgi:DNA topoisomerase-1
LPGGLHRAFKARLERIGEQKASPATKEDAERIVTELRRQSFTVASVEEKEQKRYPKPPFTTSTLQQEAFNKLGFSSTRTMRIAQQLYEGLEIGEASPVGLITYMRTDSVRIAQEAVGSLRRFIQQRFGAPSVPSEARTYKSRKTAQEAHEAIRPTDIARTPESLASSLTEEQAALYQLIWQRALASQMSDAVDRVVTVGIDAGRFHLRANGRTPVFAGWTAAYQEGEEPPKGKDEEDVSERDNVLPPLTRGDRLDLLALSPNQHFTKPPRRYTDASIIKALEEEGIGRPSTYAPTIQTLLNRDYVRRSGGSFVPTSLGRTVTEMLVEHFPEVMDVKFTAGVEEELDQVEEGRLKWVQVVRQFYAPFSSRVEVAQEQMREVKREVIPTSYVCEQCGKPMVIKWGRFGQFLSCSGYPECKTARPVPTGVSCPQPGCGGDLVERKSRGRTFYGCSKYPTCRYTARRLTKPDDPIVPPSDATAPGVPSS